MPYPAGTRIEHYPGRRCGRGHADPDVAAGSASIERWDDRRNIVPGTTVLRIGGTADPTVEYAATYPNGAGGLPGVTSRPRRA